MGALRPFDRELFFDTAETLTDRLWKIAAFKRDEVEWHGRPEAKLENAELWVRQFSGEVENCKRRLRNLLEDGDVWMLACPYVDANTLSSVWLVVDRLPTDCATANADELWQAGHAIACYARSLRDSHKMPQSTYASGTIMLVGMNGTKREVPVRLGHERVLVEAIVDYGPLTYKQLHDGFGLTSPKTTLDRLHARDSQLPGIFPDPTMRDDGLYTTTLKRSSGDKCPDKREGAAEAQPIATPGHNGRPKGTKKRIGKK